MKISLSTQTPEVDKVLPLSLLNGSFEEKCRKASVLGADGLELITTDPASLDAKKLADTLDMYHLVPSAISSGGISSGLGLTLINPDSSVAKKAYAKLIDLIDFASAVGALIVTIGSFRGRLFGDPDALRKEFIKVLQRAGEYAATQLVRLAFEPLNRYESNFINNTQEGLELLDAVGHPSVGLLIDTFHANIEESSLTQPFIETQLAKKLFHVHIADNNRLAPGLGYINFEKIFQTLKDIDYDGFISAELLSKPSADKAAELTLEYTSRFQ